MKKQINYFTAKLEKEDHRVMDAKSNMEQGSDWNENLSTIQLDITQLNYLLGMLELITYATMSCQAEHYLNLTKDKVLGSMSLSYKYKISNSRNSTSNIKSSRQNSSFRLQLSLQIFLFTYWCNIFLGIFKSKKQGVNSQPKV